MVKIEVELLLENYKLLSDIAIITGESIDAILNRLIESCANRKYKETEMERYKEIADMLKLLKEQAVKSCNDTAIIDVKKNSFDFVMDSAIKALGEVTE